MREKTDPYVMVYADCHNDSAKGDYQLACLIAYELQLKLLEKGSPIKVILCSSPGGVTRLYSMYPNTAGSLNIRGIDIPVCTPQDFDTVNNALVAFVDANRCKHAPGDVILRIMEPETRYLFVHSPHRSAPTPGSLKWVMALYSWLHVEPDLFNMIDFKNLSMLTSGIGHKRCGLPTIEAPPKDVSFPLLSIHPEQDYGFMYFANSAAHKSLEMVTQYIALTRLTKYVVLGPAGKVIAPGGGNTLLGKSFSTIAFTGLERVENGGMRYLMRNTATPVVITTGTMSTLEAMHDGKLSFYEYMGLNRGFVKSVVNALAAFAHPEYGLEIIRLGALLLAKKPLAPELFTETESLLSRPEVRNGLIHAQQTLVQRAQGTLAPRLLDIVGAPPEQSVLERQYHVACLTLSRPGDLRPPSNDQAVRRAASGNHLYALKVFLKYLPLEIIDRQGGPKQRTALHFAALMGHFEAVRLLLRKGADVWVPDSDGKTPIDLAASAKDLSPERRAALVDILTPESKPASSTQDEPRCQMQ